MKGIYTKGKPTNGSFEKVKNSDDYDYNAKVEEISSSEDASQERKELSIVPPPPIPETNGIEPQTVELLAPIDDERNSSKKRKTERLLLKKYFGKILINLLKK